jgi:LAGLIDADG endonuclease
MLLDHFDNYGLITQKLADYLLFQMGFEIFKQKALLVNEGLQSILAIKASLNLGSNDEMKLAFPDIKAVPRPLVENSYVPHPEWMAGFISGDGSFYVGVWPSNSKLDFSVSLEFKLTQRKRDKALLESFIAYFGCGDVHRRNQESTLEFRCINFSDIKSKIIPFFFFTIKF